MAKNTGNCDQLCGIRVGNDETQWVVTCDPKKVGTDGWMFGPKAERLLLPWPAAWLMMRYVRRTLGGGYYVVVPVDAPPAAPKRNRLESLYCVWSKDRQRWVMLDKRCDFYTACAASENGWNWTEFESDRVIVPWPVAVALVRLVRQNVAKVDCRQIVIRRVRTQQ